MSKSRILCSTCMALAVFHCSISYSEGATANGIPTYTAQYRLEHDNHTAGESTVTVSFDPQRNVYRYLSETRMTGAYKLLAPEALVEQSDFELHNGVITPLQYVHSGGKRGAADETITFDWNAETAKVAGKEIALHSGVLDPGSLQVATMLDLALGRQVDTYQVMDPDGLDSYTVSISELAEFDHPLASSGAIRISHERPGSSRRTTVWALPELCYLPAQIEQESGGTTTRLILDHIESKSAIESSCHT